MNPIPHPPSGRSIFSQWCKNVVNCLRQQRIIPDSTIKVSYTIQGTQIGVSDAIRRGSRSGNVPRWG